MQLKRIGVVSLGKVMGAIYAVFGLIAGAFVSLFSLIGGFAGMAGEGSEAAASLFVGVLFGAGAIVLFPIFYGVIAFVMGMVIAAVYNVLAATVGGIELELESTGQ